MTFLCVLRRSYFIFTFSIPCRVVRSPEARSETSPVVYGGSVGVMRVGPQAVEVPRSTHLATELVSVVLRSMRRQDPQQEGRILLSSLRVGISFGSLRSPLLLLLEYGPTHFQPSTPLRLVQGPDGRRLGVSDRNFPVPTGRQSLLALRLLTPTIRLPTDGLSRHPGVGCLRPPFPNAAPARLSRVSKEGVPRRTLIPRDESRPRFRALLSSFY